MYSPTAIKKMQEQTEALRKQLTDGPLATLQLTTLREVLRFHEHHYYILNNPLISDFEYDQLYKELERMEALNPELISPDSPTQRVAPGLGNDFKKVRHLVPMLSLENSYNANDLIEWDRKVKELANQSQIEYCVEPKFDGAGISVIYENDLLTRGATRGDGAEGEDITTNIKQIHSIPLSANFKRYGIRQIEIRGEVLMTKKSFKAFNEKLLEENLPPLANPRNAASGTLRIKDPKIVAQRNLEAFLYHIGYMIHDSNNSTSTDVQTHSAALNMLWELGFRSPEQEKKVFHTIDDVIAFCNAYELQRDELPYEIDGMVIKVNDLTLQEQLGMTSHHPRWAIAYKFKARQATSRLRNVEFQVGRTGAVTPVAKIDPAPIGGVTVTSISLHNEDFIREKDLRIGDAILVERAGDVIPYIVKSFSELRSGDEQPIQFPVNCPVCHDPLTKNEAEAVWRCVNINCKAQVVERIIHYNSKDAMDIRGLGDAHVRKFFEMGFLKDIPSIYHLPFDQIRKLEGYGAKSVDNLQQAIETSKTQPLHRLLYALGIRFVGETTAKTIAANINHLLDLEQKTVEELQQLEDIGPKVATAVFNFFHNADNIEMLHKLEQLGLQLNNNYRHNSTQGNLNGKTFLFTGTLPTLKRSEAEQLVEANGGSLLSGVSSKLNFLIVGQDAGSKLEKAKKIGTIQILDEASFLMLIQNNTGG